MARAHTPRVDAHRKPFDALYGAVPERLALQRVQLDLRSVAAEVQHLAERVEIMSLERRTSARRLEGVARHLERLATVVSVRPFDE
jgi:hypothetical protein